MAYITKRGDSWFAQIRCKGHKSISRSFPKKSQVQEWARSIESDIDARKYQDFSSAWSWVSAPKPAIPQNQGIEQQAD